MRGAQFPEAGQLESQANHVSEYARSWREVEMTDALPCTDLCTRLNGLTLENGRLPNHEELVSHLRFSERDKTDGRCLGTICELQERRQCAFCQLVVSAAIGDKDVGNESQLDPHETVNVFVFPKEQSFRLSYPSRLGTRLAFVAQDESQVSGPDNVRPIIGSEESSRILGWLGKCDEHHGNFCFPHPNNNVSNLLNVFPLWLI